MTDRSEAVFVPLQGVVSTVLRKLSGRRRHRVYESWVFTVDGESVSVSRKLEGALPAEMDVLSAFIKTQELRARIEPTSRARHDQRFGQFRR